MPMEVEPMVYLPPPLWGLIYLIIAGAVAESCEPLLALVRHELDRYVDPPGIEVLASSLGRDIVTVGAVSPSMIVAVTCCVPFSVALATPEISMMTDSSSAKTPSSIAVSVIAAESWPAGITICEADSV